MSIANFQAFPDTGGGQGPILESVRKIAEDDFFDAVEMAWIKDPAVRAEVRQILQIAQLQVAFAAHTAILSQKLNLNSLEDGERLAALQQMRELMDQAAELGASRFVFLSGKDPGEAQRESAFQALLASTRQMCAWGRDRGIALVLETFDRSVDKKALIGPVKDAARLAVAIKATYPDFGLLYDSSHMPILDEMPQDMAVIADHLVHIHVGNCVKVPGRPLYGDLHPYIGFPGGVNGVDELAEFIRGLFAVGYLAEGKHSKPWVGFEVKPQGPGQTPELIIANAKRTWRQAWARS
jgi:sugar phosphate isomerase/epimerase